MGTAIIRQAKQRQGIPFFKNIFNSPSERDRLKSLFESDPKNAGYLPGTKLQFANPVMLPLILSNILGKYVFANLRRLTDTSVNLIMKETTIKRG